MRSFIWYLHVWAVFVLFTHAPIMFISFISRSYTFNIYLYLNEGEGNVGKEVILAIEKSILATKKKQANMGKRKQNFMSNNLNKARSIKLVYT